MYVPDDPGVDSEFSEGERTGTGSIGGTSKTLMASGHDLNGVLDLPLEVELILGGDGEVETPLPDKLNSTAFAWASPSVMGQAFPLEPMTLNCLRTLAWSQSKRIAEILLLSSNCTI